MPTTSEHLLDLMKQEVLDHQSTQSTHESRLIEAMVSALESTVPGRSGYPNELRNIHATPPPEMI